MNTIFGQKKVISQKFLTNGTRVPATLVHVSPNVVLAVKTSEKHGYAAIQLGQGINRKPTKAEKGIIKGTQENVTPRFLREVRITDEANNEEYVVGGSVAVETVLKAGDIVNVAGISKGKGFAGGVKRHHFRGGPRTHGQSDRERAPGSIGQGTTPGRVYRGKKMAGKMGFERVTVRNLTVLDIEGEQVLLKGAIPGVPNSLIEITKVGERKNFVPIIKPVKEEIIPETVVEEVETETKEVQEK